MQLRPALRWACCCKNRCSLKVLLFLVGALSLLSLVVVGLVEEVLSWSVSPFLVRSRTSELRVKAASFNTTALRLRKHAFYHIANANACEPNAPFLLSFTVTAPSNFKAREAIRMTWSNVKTVEGHNILALFALGMSALPAVQAQIEQESTQHSDVVQGLFTDTYRNLTLKTLMIMQWAATYCPQARYILKVDDDVYVNLEGLVVRLWSLGEHLHDLYFGRIHWRVHPIRDSSSKYYAPEVAYPGDTFPSYCSGTAYVVSGDVALKIYVASLEVPLFPLEDVYVGICTEKLGIPPMHSARMAGGTHYHIDACCYKIIFTSHQLKPSEMREAWELVHREQGCPWLQKRLGLLRCKILAQYQSR